MSNTPFDIEGEARNLGHQAAEAIDPERMAAQVLSRLRQRTPWWRTAAVLRAAAVVALLAGGAALGRLTLGHGPEPAAAAHVTPGIFDGLSTTELSEMLDSMALEAPPSQLVTRGLHDLSEAQLRELLKMES